MSAASAATVFIEDEIGKAWNVVVVNIGDVELQKADCRAWLRYVRSYSYLGLKPCGNCQIKVTSHI